MESKQMSYFTRLLGEENCAFDQAHLIAYSYDATRERYLPDGVLFPRHEQDVSEILKYCNEHRIKVLARGAGSGFTGGALPAEGGLVLALEKHMNQIKEIDMENLVAVVEPGVINRDLQKAVEVKGLFYPPDPASQDYSTLGGNVSENAGGMRAAKYGITKDYVMALRAVLPSGEVIRAGKRTIKDVAGYNIPGILVGSEGTLAVITEITLRLLPKPKLSQTLMGVFDSIPDAMRAVYKTMASGVTPVAMEFLDQLTIQAVEQKYKKGLPVHAGAILIADVDGNLPEELNWQVAGIKEQFKNEGCRDFRIAQSQEEAAEIWFARRNASQSITVYGSKKLNEDITVPRSKLPELLEKIDAIAKKYQFKIPCFGHTGDGNVHTNVMLDGSNPEELKRGHEALEEVFQLSVDLGGTLSGEHGIGLSKAPFMHMAFTPAEMELFKRIKEAFDPHGILNSGKMGI